MRMDIYVCKIHISSCAKIKGCQASLPSAYQNFEFEVFRVLGKLPPGKFPPRKFPHGLLQSRKFHPNNIQPYSSFVLKKVRQTDTTRLAAPSLPI